MNYHKLALFILLMGMASSCLFHKNYVFFFFLISMLMLIQYTRPKYNVTEKKTRIKQIIENFTNHNFNFDSYSLYRFPKKFKYIYIKSDFIDNLINIRFVNIYNKEAYMKIFIILEKFLKTFYNIITNRYDKLTNLDTMKDLHQELKKIQAELNLSTPSFSNRIKRFGKKSLHHVINDNIINIQNQMMQKINLVQALIEGKIK